MTEELHEAHVRKFLEPRPRDPKDFWKWVPGEEARSNYIAKLMGINLNDSLSYGPLSDIQN